MTATKWTPSGLGYAGPPPLTNEKKLAYAAENKTDGVIIEELLRLAGITDIDSPLPEMGLTLGTLQPVALPVGQAPQSLIKRIDDLTWMDTVERADGVITRIPRSIRPSASATRTFTQGVELYNLKRSRTSEGAYANVIVTGISGVGNDGVSAYTVEYESANDIPDANGLEDTYTYQEDMIETEEIASAWGMTFLGEFAQIQESYEVELLDGDSTLHAGMTISLVSSKYGLGIDSRFLVQKVRHVAQGGGAFITYLTVKGSASPSGTDANQGPVVIINILYDLEYLDGVKTIIVILDARESYDPDAVEGAANNGIVTWVWSGDPVEPIPSSNGQQAIAIYPGGDTTGATVTLTLGDDHGKHSSKTISIKPNPALDLMVRDLWLATPASGVIFSNNGGKTWADMGVPSARGVCEVAGKTYNLGWDNAGDLYQITALMVDIVTTQVLASHQVTAASITIDVDAEETGVCWAGTHDGHVWRSDSRGDVGTWVQQTTTATKLPAEITYISESPLAAGSLQATAARGFYISFDNGVSWLLVFQHPNAGALSSHFVGGFIPLTPTTAESKGFVSFTGSRLSGEPHFVMERTDDEHPSDFAFPAGDLEVQIEAMTLEVDGSFLYAVGSDHLGHGGSWEVKPDADGEFTRKFWDNTRSGVPHHTIRDPRLIKIAYFAAELEAGKAFGGFVSTSRIRAGKALKVGIGDLHLVPPPRGSLIWIGSNGSTDRGIWALTGNGFEYRAASPLTHTVFNQVLLNVGNGVLICFQQRGDGSFAELYRSDGTGIPYRSVDGGVTWTALSISNLNVLRCAVPGTVYATVGTGGVGSPAKDLYRSDDSGATWTLVYTAITGGGSNFIVNVHPSPVDPMTVLIIMSDIPGDFYYISTDGGVTFAPTTIAQGGEASIPSGAVGVIAPSGNYLVHRDAISATIPLYRSSLLGGPVRVNVRADSGDLYDMFLGGGKVNSFSLVRGVISSSDDGITWDLVYDTTRIPTGATGLAGNVCAYVPADATNDYFVLSPSLGGNFVNIIRKAFNGDVTTPWEDLTPQLVIAATAAGHTGAYFPYPLAATRLEESI